MRDAVLRIVAQRNQIIVPSLFADVDPTSLHLRLVPMGAPAPNAGLAQIPRRYDVPSIHSDRRNGHDATRDAAALVAAARSVTDDERSP